MINKQNHHGIARAAILAALLALSFSTHARDADRSFPDTIDPFKHYIFYMHGNYVEKNGPHKKYKYYEVLDALDAKGLVVIGEARGKTNMAKYAKVVTGQVKRLLRAGVPADNITVAGHSRGGFISMQVASNLQKVKIRFGALAACGLKGTTFFKPYKDFLKKRAAEMKGNFLVMWEQSDDVAGNCDKAMNKNGGVKYTNVELMVGGGHELFYEPNAAWIDPLATFAMGG
ncbi:MAG: hypothetical protein P8Y12_12270 [Gammaproteobacteria bacterium]|jgi:pimeloyl-ACP methyl ester carboxylesterase